ncbi:GDSL-type esterase/lipase family protein [Bradyrhizobium sp. CER78]|uniref:SGNH/GDSL hydrolase family protein n=1 Tax=Bradyrhizobium sp. CER78 TaxID=3039162 RepID=UPI00244B21B1|nr:GDSL-type esterase/lipase family protein [Bradyrhizobium sp. CER78]MDH2382676.1 GDSL-type esterase/lipase family protein [Bradyrhizobium sp. CER78]
MTPFRKLSVAIAMYCVATVGAAFAKPIHIVAVGASNTQGWYVGKQGAYPAKLEALLRERGINASVANAGVPFDTTTGMLKRIDSDVPKGTDIVILQPGGNDRRFLVTKEQRAANIAAMERRLHDRAIKVILYDEEIPAQYYAFDLIHLTDAGHAFIASQLLPRVLEIDRRATVASPRAR